MTSKVWSIRIQKYTKMIQHHVHIRSTDQFNHVGVHEKKNDRNEINSVDDHCVWFFICVIFLSSVGKILGLPADWFVLTEFEVLSAIFLWLLVVTPLSQGLFLTYAPVIFSDYRLATPCVLFVGLKTSLLNN